MMTSERGRKTEEERAKSGSEILKILSLLSHSSIVRRNEGRETGTRVRKASEELKNQDCKSLLDYIK